MPEVAFIVGTSYFNTAIFSNFYNFLHNGAALYISRLRCFGPILYCVMLIYDIHVGNNVVVLHFFFVLQRTASERPAHTRTRTHLHFLSHSLASFGSCLSWACCYLSGTVLPRGIYTTIFLSVLILVLDVSHVPIWGTLWHVPFASAALLGMVVIVSTFDLGVCAWCGWFPSTFALPLLS